MRKLTHKDRNQIESIWLAKWNACHKERPTAEVWYETILEFLDVNGDELIPSDLRDKETIILDSSSKSTEYLSVLREITRPQGCTDEAILRVAMCVASKEQREEAVNKVGLP